MGAKLAQARLKMDHSSPTQKPSPMLRVLTPDTGADELRGALAANPPLEPTVDFLNELETDSQRLESATPQEILKYAIDRFAPRFTMATAFGPEGMTLIHMLAELDPKNPNFQFGYGIPVCRNVATS